MKKSERLHVPLRERNKQRMTQRIQEVAFELFRTVGYDQTTMDEIAEKVETSRGTLFNYFPTKGSLWVPFLMQQYVEYVQPKVDVYLDTQPSTLQALHFLFSTISEYVLRLPMTEHALQVLLQEIFHAYPYNGSKDPGFIATVQIILQHGQQQGDVRRDIPLEKLTRYIMILYISFISEQLEKNASPEDQLEMDTLLEFIRSGLQ